MIQRMNSPWIWVVATVALIAAAVATPWNLGGLSSHARPVQDYEQAVRSVQDHDRGAQSRMNPECLVQFMTHGQKVQRAVVFVHGYTNCPEQFHELGKRFYDLGYNVLIAPLPHHGLADRLTDEQGQLTAGELTTYADEVLDIAHGLGGQVVMAGISGGGVTTAWAAQHRSDLDLAVIISPAFGFKQIPTPLTAGVMNLFSVLPESYTWWDPALRANSEPSYAYPRYSRRALTQIMRLGFAVQTAAHESPPAAGRIVVVTNGNEPSVNNELTMQVLTSWRQHTTNVTSYEFPANLGLPHDLIDPSQPDQRTDIVYPKLIQLITQ
jgi:pimeloyl-ACP methyl ester carboxylesterase